MRNNFRSTGIFFCLLTCAILLSPALKAQVRLGLIGGPLSSSINETNSLPGWPTDYKPYFTSKSNIHIGFIAEVPLDKQNRVFLQPAIMYMPRGNKFSRTYQNDGLVNDTFSVNETLTVNYIDIPLNLAYKLPLTKTGRASLLLSAGPYLSFFYNGNKSSEVRTYDDSSNIVLNGTQKNLEVGKAEGKYKTADFGYNLRGGFDFGNIAITGFLSQGLGSFYQASYSGNFKHKVVGASLIIWLTKTDKKIAAPIAKLMPTPLDTDMDGVPDADDLCPRVPGVASNHGCPLDTDKDGVADMDDKCPTITGVAKYNGCPVPDSDHDGINDELDSCRDVVGVEKYHGCPVPDKDGDGIADDQDKCPELAGIAANNGCPQVSNEITRKIDEQATQILFQSASDQLTTSSFTSINEVADLLKADSKLQITVSGYTDNSGKKENNVTLSQKRAGAVKHALEKAGIDAGRIAAQGFGDADPVADNSTPEGRRKNRRVEIKLRY